MTVRCGAGTTVREVDEALGAHGQLVALPDAEGATVGGVLAVGQQRHPPPRLRPGPRRAARGALRVGRGHARQGGRADGEERERLRSLPSARGLARHHRPARRGVPALPPAARRGRSGSRARPTRSRCAGRCTGPRRSCGTARRPGCCSKAIRPTSTTRRASPACRRSTGRRRCRPRGRRSLRPAELRALTGEFVAEIGVGIVHLPHPVDPPEPDARRPAPAHQGRLRPDRSPQPRAVHA